MIITETRFRVICDTCSDEHVSSTVPPNSFSPTAAEQVAVESGYDVKTHNLHRCRSCVTKGRTKKAEVA